MMEEKSRPGEKAANPYEVRHNSTAYPPTIVLSDGAESYLDQLAIDLALGNVETRQLSRALSQFYWLAWACGHASHDSECAAQLDRMRWERDLWYFCNANRKSPSDFYAAATSALWVEGAA
jgi:hypothetical protein